MYQLDLETLLLVLRARSGALNASIPSLPGMKGLCRIVVNLVNGNIVSCMIQDQQGNMITGEQAMRLLRGKVLNWTYQEQQAPPSVLSSTPSPGRLPAIPRQPTIWSPSSKEVETSPVSFGAIPRRMGQPSQEIFQSWSRLQRSVFMLIDGTRSVAVIAYLLRQDDKNIASVITEMAQLGVIEL